MIFRSSSSDFLLSAIYTIISKMFDSRQSSSVMLRVPFRSRFGSRRSNMTSALSWKVPEQIRRPRQIREFRGYIRF